MSLPVIRWSSLIADEGGTIDYARVRSLTSVVLAIVGGGSAVWVLFVTRTIATELVAIMVAALVLPLTGGKIADVFSNVSQSKAATKIQTGEAPGRRVTDPAVVVIATEGKP